MFLLPSLVVGVVFALLLGGRPSRLLEIELRRPWTVVTALGAQILLFSPLDIGSGLVPVLHIGTYVLLFAFFAANVRNLALIPLFLGMAMNAAALVTNGGLMPVSPSAAAAAGVEIDGHSNVRVGAEHLGFLGDVFALPARFPLANVFSIGDLLIGLGAVALIVAVATGGDSRRMLVPARLLVPFSDVSFRRLAIGKLVSHFGDWLTLAALVGWVYADTKSTGQVALLMLIRLVPPILGGGLAAAVVDRLRKERLLVWIELMRGAAVAGALAAVLFHARPLAFVAVACSGALAAISAATVPALVPSLLEDEQFPAANAALGIAQDAAMALGSLAAGIALTASHTFVALAVDLGTFAVAACLYWGIRPRTARSTSPDEPQQGVREGIRYLLHRRLLLVVVGSFGAATLATGLTNATLPRFLDIQLGLGPGGYGFGLAALACGLAVGQALVGFSRVGPSGERWIGAGLLVMAVLFVALGLTEHAPTALLLLGLIGLLDGTTDVLFDTVVQRDSDPRYYGRVFGLASAFMTTTMMGAVAAAPLVNRFGSPMVVILLAGFALLVASVIAILGAHERPTASPTSQGVGSPERAQA